MPRNNPAEDALLDFIDEEATSLVHALRTMAERNEEDAEKLSKHSAQVVVDVLRQSAKVWRAKADEFDRLFDAIPMRGED